jgi:hypothetical protein
LCATFTGLKNRRKNLKKFEIKQKTSNDINFKFCEFMSSFHFLPTEKPTGKYTPPYGTARGDPIPMERTVSPKKSLGITSPPIQQRKKK